jgi:hypothetical protein
MQDTAEADMLNALQLMESIMQGLVSDQLACASIVMVAASHSENGAQKVASALRAKTLGYHPDLLDKITDLGPAPAEPTFDKRTDDKYTKRGFRPVKTTKKSEPAPAAPASRAANFKSYSKRAVPGSVDPTESGNN